VNFAGLWRTGKNTAAAMAHATSTTRLRMTHDGSMRFLERAEAFSLFFFFFFSAESASARVNAARELPNGLRWLGGICVANLANCESNVRQCEAENGGHVDDRGRRRR
jgi:hypothetical protein